MPVVDWGVCSRDTWQDVVCTLAQSIPPAFGEVPVNLLFNTTPLSGFNCVIVARRRERLEALKVELEGSYGVYVTVVVVDLSTEKAVHEIRRHLRGIPVGVLVNNAGVGFSGMLHKRVKVDEEGMKQMREVIEVNCTAPTLLYVAMVLPVW